MKHAAAKGVLDYLKTKSATEVFIFSGNSRDLIKLLRDAGELRDSDLDEALKSSIILEAKQAVVNMNATRGAYADHSCPNPAPPGIRNKTRTLDTGRITSC